MLWQLLAMWVIVGSVTVWFLRDEMRLNRSRQLQRIERIMAAPAAMTSASAVAVPLPALAAPKPARPAHQDRARFLAALARD
ncbi:MAG: hypothetical protein KIT02_13075 [Devosia sp.]|uniref:hypothetical protein n=1 Tax=Devosia sp. TaxID=1871048 RepID=UPI0024CCB973|nr:hypothetical protein [Devosia sp.]UYN98860.1 MAG: hypothetical protein KIT02_13075 [Devosia sp.]